MVAVSIIIPTYNRSNSIIDSVESVLRQTFDDFEVIVVDDCSSDNTVELLSKVADPRLRTIVHDRNKGAGAARNTGIRAATGKYIAFQDSDDEWLPTKLAKQVAVLKEKCAGWVAVYCGMLVVRDINWHKEQRTNVRYLPQDWLKKPGGDLHEGLLEHSFISTQTLVVRRDALHTAGEFDETLPALEDWDYIIRIAQVGKIAFVDEPLVLQRFSHDSITRHERRRVAAHLQILQKIEKQVARSSSLMSSHYYTLSGSYRDLGDQASAMKYIRRCIALQPFRVKYLLAAAYLTLLTAKNILHRNGQSGTRQ